MTFEQIINEPTPTLVDFFATWCGPCKAMMPALETLKTEMGDQIRIIKIDVDKNTDLAVAQKVMEDMKLAGLPSISCTGLESGDWALIDFGDFIVHVMQPESRQFYNLEGLWEDHSNS